MNRLLQRQLKSIFGKAYDYTTLDPEIQLFLERVTQAYDEYDKEKRLLMHTIDINTEELISASETIEKHNTTLKDQIKEKTFLLEQYKEAIDDTMIVSKTDKTGRITYVNDPFCKLSGYTKEELIGTPHSIVRHPDEPKEIFKQLWNTILQKKKWQGEIKNMSKDGQTYYVDAHIFPLVDKDNNIIEFIAIRIDLTRRIMAEQTLQREHHFNEMLFDNQENIVFTASKKRGLHQANKNFYKIFGFKDLTDFKTQHTCICENFLKAPGFLEPASAGTCWADAILNNPHKEHRALIKVASGEKRIFNVRVNPMEFEDKEFIISSFTDITELEHEREKATASEKSKSAFMANMSHEIRTPMNGILGFTELLEKTELNPLQQKYTQLIEHSTSILLKIVNDILDFSKIESGNLELDFTEVNPFIALHNSISFFRSQTYEKSISYLIDIDASLSECLLMDELRITQVLNNLINNAIKFTPKEGTIHVKLEKISQTQDKETVRFSVRDTGIGIPKDRLDSIFQSFAQADSSTTRNFGGTGLGLSISASLCQLMGSELKVDSEPNKGSTFYFDLSIEVCTSEQGLIKQIPNSPIVVLENPAQAYTDTLQHLIQFGLEYQTFKVEAVKDMDFKQNIVIVFNYLDYLSLDLSQSHVILIDSSEAAQALSKRIPNITLLSLLQDTASDLYNALVSLELITQNIVNTTTQESINLHILVAEDYEINRILIEEIFKQYNIIPDFAFDGREALIKASHTPYDLIFMDINMPELNGLDATKEIKAKGITTPIVALTANALEGDREHFIKNGMDDYLSKPIQTQALEEILKKYANQVKPKEIDSQTNDDIFVSDIVKALKSAQEQMYFDTEIMIKLFESFLSSSIKNAQQIQTSVQNSDLTTIKGAAHAIRGSAMSLGLDEIASICNDLEYNLETIDYKKSAEELYDLVNLLEDKKVQIIARYHA